MFEDIQVLLPTLSIFIKAKSLSTVSGLNFSWIIIFEIPVNSSEPSLVDRSCSPSLTSYSEEDVLQSIVLVRCELLCTREPWQSYGWTWKKMRELDAQRTGEAPVLVLWYAMYCTDRYYQLISRLLEKTSCVLLEANIHFISGKKLLVFTDMFGGETAVIMR